MEERDLGTLSGWPAIRSLVRRYLTEWRALLVPIGIMSAIYILGLSALLRANFNYGDDMGRVFSGYTEWNYYSRYLSVILSRFLHASSYLADISPLPQLFAAVFMGTASVIILHVLTEKVRFTAWEYAAAVPLGFFPYYLACFSYKYDSPYMALSVLVSAAPLLFAAGPVWLYWLASFCGTVLMCTSYQASAGIFPMFVAVVLLKRWLDGEKGKKLFSFFCLSVAGYILGLLFYRLVIMHRVALSEYSYAATDMNPPALLIPKAIANYKIYLNNLLTEMKPLWLVLLALLYVLFVLAAVCRSRRNKALSLLIAAAAPIVLLVLSVGVYPFLAAPLYGARSMYGVGAAVALMGVFAVTGKKRLPAKLVCLALAWCFFTFAFIYGNALFVQKTYTDFRITETVDSLKDLDTYVSADEPITQITGSIGYAPPLQRTIEEFPVLRKLVTVNFGDSSQSWAFYGFNNYYGLPKMTWTTSIDLRNFHLPVLDETIYHTIYGNEHFILIELK